MNYEKFNYFLKREESGVMDIDDIFKEFRKTSFYAPVLIEAFQESVDQSTITSDVYDDIVPKVFVGGKLKDFDYGYSILEGSLRSELVLKIARWRHWEEIDEERFKRSFSESGFSGPHNRVTISANQNSDAGMETFVPRQRLVVSDLKISFYPERWQVAPGDHSLDWWVLTQFVPDFIERVKPLARVPREEMEQWKDLSK